MIESEIKHEYLKINDIQLHVVTAGPEDGKPLLLLHGFPEFWYAWRHQIDALVNAGFRLWMPDLRGFNLSDKPDEIAAYTLDVVADDIVGLLDYIGREQGFVIGHDWGGASLWWAANKFPDRFEKIAILNVPHHRAFRSALRENAKQRRRSAYMQFFQFKGISEFALKFRSGKTLAGWAFGSDHPAYPPETLKKYYHAWAQKDAIEGMLKWYRAAKQIKPAKLDSPHIQPPTLIIWGKQDKAFLPELAQASLDLCDQGRLEMLENASHWVQHEEAERVNSLLMEWFS